MTKAMMCAHVTTACVLIGTPALAQTAAPPETGAYVSLGVGGQPQKRSFGSSGTFTSFNEIGKYQLNQNIGAGFLFDVAGGYRFTKHLSAGVGVWNARSNSAASAAASIPDPVVFGRFANVSAAQDTGLKQSTVGINFFVTYWIPVAQRFDLAVSVGPTIVRTRLDAGSVTVTPSNQKIALTTDSESKTSAKAGNVGVDFSYRVNALCSLGLFARYAGGELDLPAVQRLKVGTVQTGGLIRYRF